MDEVEAMLPEAVRYAGALDIFVESIAFGNEHLARMGELAAAAGVGLRAHVEQFSTMRSVPVALAAGARSVDHLSLIHADDIEPLARSECAAVLLPGAEFLGAEHRAPARALIDAGAIVVLATDANPGTSPVFSLPLVIGLAVRRYGISTREALLAVDPERGMGARPLRRARLDRARQARRSRAARCPVRPDRLPLRPQPGRGDVHRRTPGLRTRRRGVENHAAMRIPAMANAHSHAFQIDLRGVAEHASPHDDFWSWRTEMYRLAAKHDPDSMRAVGARTYAAMARAGYGAVGEFHYVHHQPDGRPYAEPNAMAIALAQAAREHGLEIVLLPAAYNRAGPGLPPTGDQRRFCDPDVDTFLARVDDLRSWASAQPGVSVGVAVHSVRAVPAGWIEAVAAYAERHDLVRHVHACEQRRELAECRGRARLHADRAASPLRLPRPTRERRSTGSTSPIATSS